MSASAPTAQDWRLVPFIDDDGVRWEIMPKLTWYGVAELPSFKYVCGFCGTSVGSALGVGGSSNEGQTNSMSAAKINQLPRRAY